MCEIQITYISICAKRRIDGPGPFVCQAPSCTFFRSLPWQTKDLLDSGFLVEFCANL